MKAQYFWKTSFWLHKLVIQTHFKYQIQYITQHAKFAYFRQNIALFNGINTFEATIFVLFGFF